MTIQAVGQKANSFNEQIFKTATMSNEEIVRRAYASGNKASSQKASAKLLKALPALAVGGVALVNGMATKGKLSNKTKSALYTVGTFAVVSAVYDGVHGIIKKIKEKDNNIKQADDKYPLAGALVKLGASFGAAALVLKGIGKSTDKLAKKFPKLAEKHQKMSKSISDMIDKSSLSKVSDKVSNSLKNISKKHPNLSSFAKRNSFLLMIAGYIGLSTLLIAKNEKNKQKAIYDTAQDLTKKRAQAQGIMQKATELNTTSV